MRLKVVYSVCNAATSTRSTYIARQDSCSAQLSPSGQHASTELKACLQAICLTKPDLGPSATSDYAVSVLDVMESERIFEGKGMMGWLLAEQQGLAQVTGRLIDDPATRTSGGAGEDPQILEIVLELVPRPPVNRTDFMSSLNSSQSMTSQQQALPMPQAINAPTPPTNNANSNNNDMLQAMSTIMSMAQNGSNDMQRNFQILAQLFQQNPAAGQQQQGNSTLLPGINLFNPSRVIQQQRNASVPASEPVKPTTSRSNSRNSNHSNGSNKANEGAAALALMSSAKKASAQIGVPRMKYWEAGCLKCGVTESTQWRVRKKRSRPLDGSDAAAPDAQDGEEGIKKLCEECAKDLPSMRKKRAEEEAAAAAAAYSAEASTAPSQPGQDKSAAEPLALTYDSTGRARPRSSVAVQQQKAATARQQTAPQIQTSPLRRSPRRMNSAVSNVRQQAGGRGQQSQPFTSPSRPSNDSEQTGTGLGASKRRKFTTALSTVALREEIANSPAAQKLEEPSQPKKRRITPTNLSKSVPAPDRFKSPNFGSANVAGGAGGNEDDFHFLGASASYCPSSMSSSGTDLEKQRKQAKAIFETASPKSSKPMGRTVSDERMTDFLMNASPGTAIRSLLGETPKLGKLSGGFPSVQDTPGKVFGKYLLDGLALPAGLSSYDIPDIDSNKISDSQIDPLLSGPSFSPLSTPFRNAIFQTGTSKTPAGPVNPVSPGKRISPRATSEQPPSAHEKLLATLHGPHGPSGLATSQTMHLSSDDTNFGFSTTSAAGHPLINLLPPTADRSKSIAAVNLPMQGSEFTSDMPTSYPDALLDDFSSFLLKTSSSLFTSPSPPRKTAARPGLAIPQQPGLGGRRHSTPTPLNFAPSSEAFDTDKLDPQLEVDMRDLPPSSPPPLPGTATNSGGSNTNLQSAYQNYLDSFLAGLGTNGAEDTQSPISVGTSATQGGTPQEIMPSFAASITTQSAPTKASAFTSTGDGFGNQEHQSSETSFDVDMTLIAGDRSKSMDDSFGILDEGVSMEDDPLLSFFGQNQQQGGTTGKATNPIVDKLKYSAGVGSENMALSWSETTASSSSLPDYENISNGQQTQWQTGKM